MTSKFVTLPFKTDVRFRVFTGRTRTGTGPNRDAIRYHVWTRATEIKTSSVNFLVHTPHLYL
jgi:hypothetical protein